MTRPPNYTDAAKRGLVAKTETKFHCFSNGTEYDCWASGNCFRCKYWPPEGPAGEYCALEAAMFLDTVTPELAELFGFRDTQTIASDGIPIPHKTDCRFFSPLDDDEDWTPPPPPPDPDQLVLLADPSEDAAIITNAPVEVEALTHA